MPYFSIIVPIYSVPEKYFRTCIESVLNQTYSEYELILVDDNSPDDCGKICDEYKEKYENIHVIHQSKQGVSVARNNGLKIAKGEWIVFIDADDWIDKNYLESFLEMINEKKADIYISSCYVNYKSTQVVNPFFKEKELIFNGKEKDRAILQFLCSSIYSDDLGTADVGAPWAKIYSRQFLVKNNLNFDSRLLRMQDNIFNLYAFEYADTIIYKNKPIYHYRKSVHSGFSRYNPNIIQYYELVFDIVEKFIKKFNKPQIFYDALDIKVIKSFYVYLKMDYLNKNNSKSVFEIDKEIRNKLSEKIYKNALGNYKKKFMNKKERLFVKCLKYKMTFSLMMLMKGKDLFYKLLKRDI